MNSRALPPNPLMPRTLASIHVTKIGMPMNNAMNSGINIGKGDLL